MTRKMTVEQYEFLAHREGECLISHRAKGSMIARHVYQLRHGKIESKNVFVCHTCDNPLCILDAHHFLGTNADNMRDCRNKGRHHGNNGHIPSEETRAKISQSTKGKKKSASHCKKISESRKGKPLSKEHKKKLAIGSASRWSRQEERDKMSASVKRYYESRKL